VDSTKPGILEKHRGAKIDDISINPVLYNDAKNIKNGISA
jgi:hypothetical protein